MPPEGKLEASGSPFTSSLPLNSATARPSEVEVQEGVVLLRGDAGQRLEPVRVVGRTVFDGPVLERGGDDVRDRVIDRLAVRDRAPERAKRLPSAAALAALPRWSGSRSRRPACAAAAADAVRAEAVQSLMLRIASPEDEEPIRKNPFAVPVQDEEMKPDAG